MARKKFFNHKVFFVFIACLLIVLGVILAKFFYPSTKTYHSKFLKITIDYPAKYQLEERFGEITLKSKSGKIIISTNGTNYESIDGYLENLSKLNNFTITSEKKVQFKYELATIVTIDNGNKDYFFYPTERSVYVMSASSPNLYPDLDQIALSFRYEQ